MISFTYGKNRR